MKKVAARNSIMALPKRAENLDGRPESSGQASQLTATQQNTAASRRLDQWGASMPSQYSLASVTSAASDTRIWIRPSVCRGCRLGDVALVALVMMLLSGRNGRQQYPHESPSP